MASSCRCGQGRFCLTERRPCAQPGRAGDLPSQWRRRSPQTVALSWGLASPGVHGHGLRMFVITEADAAAIRAIFDEEGELAAANELRRRFPGVSDNAKARACARTIAGWKPLPEPPGTVTRLRPISQSLKRIPDSNGT